MIRNEAKSIYTEEPNEQDIILFPSFSCACFSHLGVLICYFDDKPKPKK